LFSFLGNKAVTQKSTALAKNASLDEVYAMVCILLLQDNKEVMELVGSIPFGNPKFKLSTLIAGKTSGVKVSFKNVDGSLFVFGREMHSSWMDSSFFE